MDQPMSWRRLLPLTTVVTLYLCLGALLFQQLEGDPEIQRRQGLRQMIKAFIENKTCIAAEELHEFISAISSETEFAQGVLQNVSVSTRWDFTGSFSFVVTVATTIGYGNMSPHTEFGKLVVIAYALIGIPLTFLMLQGLGQHMTVLSKKVNKLKLCSKRPGLNKYMNMVLIIVIGMTLLFVGPTFLFMNVEGWSLMEGIYYCFVTLSTIGFGDFIPALSENRFSGRSKMAGTVYRIVAYTWILFGLAYVALIINYITSVLVRRAEKVEKMSKAKLESEIKQLQKELQKKKSNIFSLASNMAESLSTGLDSVRRSTSNIDMTDQSAVVLEVPSVPPTPHSPFRNKKNKDTIKEGPVKLVAFRKTSDT